MFNQTVSVSETIPKFYDVQNSVSPRKIDQESELRTKALINSSLKRCIMDLMNVENITTNAFTNFCIEQSILNEKVDIQDKISKVIRDSVNNLKEKIKKEMKNVSYANLTVHSFDYLDIERVFLMNISFLDDEWNFKRYYLSSIRGNITENNEISGWIENVIEEYNLKDVKINFVAKNKFCREIKNITYVKCLGSEIDRILDAAIDIELISILEKIIGFYVVLRKNQNLLKSIQETDIKLLIKDAEIIGEFVKQNLMNRLEL